MAQNKVVVADKLRRKITWLGKTGQVVEEQTIEPGEVKRKTVPLQLRRRV